jgi:HAD superfamily hydrolase (TIGR01509 family)
MNQIQAVIFDMDGLLLDTERIALGVFLETCEHFGIGDQTELFIRCIGTNQALGERILRQGLQGKADYKDFSRLWEASYQDRTSKEPVPLKEGAEELINRLSLRNIPMAVATSTKTPRAMDKLEKADILNRFAAVIGGDQVENSKPRPEIFLKAAEILLVGPERCLALEDSDNGVRAAVGAGMTVIQIPDLVQPSRELTALGHTILGSLNEVLDFVFRGGMD